MIPNPINYSNILLKSLYLIEQPGQSMQTYRPMQANFDTNAANSIQNMARAATSPNGTIGVISEKAAARVAPTILRPSDAPMGNLLIDNGWATKRFLIYMDFECTSTMGTVHREVISAYTDHPGVSVQTKSIDPNMRCYVNNYMSYRTTQQHTPAGSRTMTQSITNAGIMANLKLEGAAPNSRSTGLRPSDAMASMSMLEFNTDDLRSSITDTPTSLSDVNNSLVGHYLSTTLNAYNSVEQNEYDSYGSDSTRYSLVSQELTDDSLANSSFYNWIASFTDIAMTGYFTMGDIMSVFPMVEGHGVYKVNLLDNNSLDSLAGITTDWGVTSVEGRTLFGLTHSLPAILRKYMVRYYEFIVTDTTMTGVPAITPTAASIPFFKGLHDPAKASMMDEALMLDVVNQMLSNNIYGYHMKVRVNLFGNVTIDLSRNGGATWVPYTAPVFCDRLTSPLRAATESQAKTHAHDIGTAINTVFNGIQISNHSMSVL